MTDSDSQKQYPQFEWDHDVPDTPFWADLPFTTARNFLKCYSPEQLDAMSFPPEMKKEDKWNLLLSRLSDKLARQEMRYGPQPFYEEDYKFWHAIQLGIYTMHFELKQLDKAEAVVKEMGDHGTYNGKMSAKSLLSDLQAARGNYGEAEALGRECLPWLRGLEMLGPGSPQALGCERRLMTAIWKQGRYDEARELQEDMQGLISGLGGSQFEKYKEEEDQMLRDKISELDKWKEDHGQNVTAA